MPMMIDIECNNVYTHVKIIFQEFGSGHRHRRQGGRLNWLQFKLGLKQG